MRVRLLGLNSSRFLSAFKVREINAVVFFINKFLYISFGNVLSYYSFYAWIKYVLHGSNIFCMKSMLEPHILFTIKKCGDIMFCKFE